MTEHHLDHPSLDGLNRMSAQAPEFGETDEYGEVTPDEGDGDEEGANEDRQPARVRGVC